jgi:galactose mutarotase-like enzyme
VLGTDLHPLRGSLFALDVAIEYAPHDEDVSCGLGVTTTARNLGDLPCPYDAGQHPYLAVARRSWTMPRSPWTPDPAAHRRRRPANRP